MITERVAVNDAGEIAVNTPRGNECDKKMMTCRLLVASRPLDDSPVPPGLRGLAPRYTTLLPDRVVTGKIFFKTPGFHDQVALGKLFCCGKPIRVVEIISPIECCGEIVCNPDTEQSEPKQEVCCG